MIGRAARLDDRVGPGPLGKLLERPRIYAWAGHVLAPGARRAVRARILSELDADAGGRALDIGCGPRSWLLAAGVSPVGVDASLGYIRASRGDGAVGVVARAEELPFRSGAFGSVWSFGLLHHLSDDAARRALAEAARVSGGRVVVFDGVLPRARARRPFAWLLRRWDRGRFHRAEASLRGLLPGPGWQVARFTYSWSGLEGLWCARG